MKKLLLFLILYFSLFFLNAQDIIYTVKGEISSRNTPIDSILVENISNKTRILFDDLPDLPDYNINLTQKALWGATIIKPNEQNPGFKVTSNYPGYLCLTYNQDIPTVASISIFNLEGQKVYTNNNQILSKGNSIRIYLGRSKFYAVKIASSFGVQGFKVMGSLLHGNNKTKVNITEQANPFKTVFIRPKVLDDNFNYRPGDSIRISVYKKGYYAYPDAFRINGYDSIIFPFKISTVDSTGISDVYANLSDASRNTKIIGYNTTNGDIQIKYSGKAPELNPGEIVTVDLDTMGYLRKVLTVSKENGVAIVKTKQARMEDVFVNRDIKLDTKLIAPKIALKSTSTYKEIAQALTDNNGYIHPVKIIYQDQKGQSKTVDVLKEGRYANGRKNIIDFYRDLKSDLYGKKGKNVHLYIDEGHISLTSDAVFALDFTNNNAVANGSKAKIGNLRSVEFYLDSHADFLIKLALDMQKEYEKEDGKELARIPKVRAKFIVPPGIPVWITFKCTINSRYYFKSDAALHADWGFESNHTLKIGGLYSRETNRFEPIKEYTPKNTIFPLNITGDVNDTVRLEIYPRVDIKLYGLLGPYAEIVPYITGDYHAKFLGQYSANNSQTFLAWNSGIDLGLDFRTGIDMSFIGSLCEASVNCFNIPLWSSPKKIDLLSTLPKNMEPGETLILKYKVTDLTGNPVYLCPVYFNGPGKFKKQLLMTQMDGTVSCEWTATNPGNNSIQAIIYRANKSIIDRVSTVISINDPPPVAGFTAVPTLGVAPLKVTFIDQSTKTPTSWKWDFGDTTATSAEKNPTHIYNHAGKYTVQLTVSNKNGKNTKLKQNYIVVGYAPTADFTADKTKSSTAPFTVYFSDQSGHIPTSWTWDFGDGNTSSQKNPSHTYEKEGNYTVSLSVTNKFGRNMITKKRYIIIGKKPLADFKYKQSEDAKSLTVAFTDMSTNSPSSWKWDFGDGNTSSQKNPSHTYQNTGNYTVKLTVSNGNGEDSTTKQVTVSRISGSAPIAEFSANPTSGEVSLLVKFTDQSANNPTSWKWDFGDGSTSSLQNPSHTYQNAGNYTIKLTASNQFGSNTKIKSKLITVTDGGGAIGAYFSASPTSGEAPLTVTFTDLSKGNPTSWTWNFGDGSTNSQQNPTHTYHNKGTYSVKLTITYSNGGGSSLIATDYISVTESNVFTDPRDGQTYKTVKIGNQTWFAENLNYKTNDSWWYNNDSANGTVYGRLYTWDAAKNACPTGWHLPSDDEWKTLEMYLGMSQSEADNKGARGTNQGKKMKSTSGWINNGNGTNSSGFNALPGGYRNNSNESFFNLGSSSLWWSSSTYSFSGYPGTIAWVRNVEYNTDKVYRNTYIKSAVISVRCVKTKK